MRMGYDSVNFCAYLGQTYQTLYLARARADVMYRKFTEVSCNIGFQDCCTMCKLKLTSKVTCNPCLNELSTIILIDDIKLREL